MIRTVLIGYGGMGKQDAALLYSGKVKGMRLTGICCRNAAGQAEIRTMYPDVQIYADADMMFADAERFDALVIVTPHTSHVELASRAAQLGKHLLVDKPLGISSQEVRGLLEVVRQRQTALGVIFNMRAYPAYQKTKQLLQGGILGDLNRVVWVINNWYRSPAYHCSNSWRSTWKGEGGGLLINQCQHPLDLWQWLFGMPTSLYADIDYGKYNRFAVDDAVDIQMKYDNGIHGTFIASSGEAPGVNRLEIWGTKGRLCVENNSMVTLWENKPDTTTFGRENRAVYGTPGCTVKEITVKQDFSDSYCLLFQQFVDYLHGKRPLLADGEDGLRTLILANGAYLSSWLHQEVLIPFDDEQYNLLLQEKMRQEV